VTVALDKKDIPTGTVAGMAKHCGMTLADFCTMLGIDL
jgi:N-acetylglutamate synthase/N-acetylornithine aminotransferase